MNDCADITYNGVDNLEAMAEAKNYNRYLANLVTATAQENSQIVDFGAGTGLLTRIIATRGFNISCIETDPVLRKTLESQNFSCFRSLKQLPPNSVDYAYSFNVLEHIEDDYATCNDIIESLKPGGKLLIYVPAFQILYSSMDRKVGHYRRYTRKTLVHRLETAGFRVQRSRYVDSVGYIATMAFKMFGNDDGTIAKKSVSKYDRFIFPVSQILDYITGRLFGKNVVAWAEKP